MLKAFKSLTQLWRETGFHYFRRSAGVFQATKGGRGVTKRGPSNDGRFAATSLFFITESDPWLKCSASAPFHLQQHIRTGPNAAPLQPHYC